MGAKITMATEKLFFYFDDHFLPIEAKPISPFATAFLYGNGVFETIRLYNGKPFLLSEHLQRLAKGIDFLALARPAAWEEISTVITQLVKLNRLDQDNGVVRVICGDDQTTQAITNREKPSCHLIIQVFPLDLKLISQKQAGVKTCILPWKRDPDNPLLKHKTLNYLENFHGRKLAEQQGVQEGIFLNFYHELCEGTYSNIFLVGKDSLVTPPVSSGLLPGITRAAIIKAGKTIGLKCREERISPEMITYFKGGFLSSSLMELAPLENLGPQQFDPRLVAELQRALLNAYRQLTGKLSVKKSGKV